MSGLHNFDPTQLAAAMEESIALAAKLANRRGKDKPLPFTNAKGTVFFPQNVTIDHLCGQYALNHILQEEKCVWLPNNNNMFIYGDNAKDPNVKINLWQMCNFYKEAETKKYKLNLITTKIDRIKKLLNGVILPPVRGKLTLLAFSRQQLAYNKELAEAEHYRNMDDDTIKAILLASTEDPVLDAGSLCVMNGLVGELPDGIFPYILDLLELRYTVKRGEEAQIELVDNIDNKNLLGVVFGNSSHYIALVKYSNRCDKGKYTVIDSLSCKTNNAEQLCLDKKSTLEGMGLYITNRGRRGGESKGISIFIYADDNSYQAEAVKRMKSINAAASAPAAAAAAPAAPAAAAAAPAAPAASAPAAPAAAAFDQNFIDDLLLQIDECNEKLKKATKEIGKLKTERLIKLRGSPALRAVFEARAGKGGTRKHKKVKSRSTLRR